MLLRAEFCDGATSVCDEAQLLSKKAVIISGDIIISCFIWEL